MVGSDLRHYWNKEKFSIMNSSVRDKRNEEYQMTNEYKLQVEENLISQKQELKESIKQIFKQLLIYLGIFIGVVFGFSFIAEVLRLLPLDFVTEELIQNITDAGNIFGSAIAILVFYKKQKIAFLPTVKTHRQTLSLKQVAIIIILLLGCQFVFNQVANIFEVALNVIGFSAKKEVELATVGHHSSMYFLYAAFMGPLVEELVMRGGIAYRLQKYGKVFSIIFSAIVFGFFHMNFVQGVFAFLVGIMLAYIAIEYSFGWAVFFHILNNFGFNLILGTFMTSMVGEAQAETISLTIMSIAAVASVILLGMFRKQIVQYVQENRTAKGTFKVAFSSVLGGVFFIICIIVALLGLQPL